MKEAPRPKRETEGGENSLARYEKKKKKNQFRPTQRRRRKKKGGTKTKGEIEVKFVHFFHSPFYFFFLFSSLFLLKSLLLPLCSFFFFLTDNLKKPRRIIVETVRQTDRQTYIPKSSCCAFTQRHVLKKWKYKKTEEKKNEER